MNPSQNTPLLRKLSLSHYKGFEGSLLVNLDEKLTLLIGINGCGKTSVLDAIHSTYSFLLGKLIPRLESTKTYKNSVFDVNNNCQEADIQLNIDFVEEFTVKIQLSKIAKTKFVIDKNTNPIFNHFSEAFHREEIQNLPIYKYVRSENTEKQKKAALKTELYAIYDDYNDTSLNFLKIKEWFKWQQNKNPNAPIFNEVKKALYQMLSDNEYSSFSEVYIDWETPEGIFTIKKAQTKVFENQLSSGEKRLFALVGEIAMRLCLASPASKNPLSGTGIVLIDEIDLHLHPKWQRKVVTKLREIFPNVQFVITTHSPVILTELYSKHIRVLDNGHIFGIRDSFGHSEEEMLEEMGGQSERKKLIKEIHRLLAQNKISEAKEKRAKIEVEGDFAPLLEIDLFIQRKEKATL